MNVSVRTKKLAVNARILLASLLYLNLLGCDSCNVKPAEPDSDRKSMTFQIFAGNNDPNSSVAPCFLNPTAFQYYEIQLVVNTNGVVQTQVVNTTINSSGQFTINVPEEGAFVVHIRIEQPCNICCSSTNNRNPQDPPNCPSVNGIPKNGIPIFQAEQTYVYSGEIPLIKPMLKICRCSC